MGEEKKKPEGEEKKAEEGKNPEPEKKAEKTEKAAAAAAAAAAATEEKPKSDEKKSEDGKKDNNNNNDKDGKDAKEEQPPPPPPEIVLRVYMHCEGCARKVRKCLKGFDGVEDVTTDCKTHKVVVKGENADPLKVLNRVQKKTHRQVELLSPILKPPAEEPKKAEEKEAPKPEEKKEEPKIITVVLKVHMHCEACSLEIKKRIEKMKEVEVATPDLKNSSVTVKGTFEAAKIVEYVYKRTGKHASIVSQDPPAEKKEDGKGKEGKEEKKGENDEGKKGEQKGEGKGDKKEEAGGGGEGGGGGEEGKGVAGEGDGAAVVVEEGPRIVELKRNEFNHYPPRYALDMYAYPPQIFSDENPNACSIM